MWFPYEKKLPKHEAAGSRLSWECRLMDAVFLRRRCPDGPSANSTWFSLLLILLMAVCGGLGPRV